LKVKIVKCSNDDFWYTDSIGEIIDVTSELGCSNYRVKGGFRGIIRCDVVKVCCDTCGAYCEFEMGVTGCLNGKCKNYPEYDRWEYKGAEPKVENKNYIPEVCKMLGHRVEEKFNIVNLVGKEILYNPYYFTDGALFNCNNNAISTILDGLIKGELIIEPIVEFAKPIKCNDGDKFRYVSSNGNIIYRYFSGRTFDRYLLRDGNMFSPDAVIPQEQINQIVGKML
jgi:hypothetical protein